MNFLDIFKLLDIIAKKDMHQIVISGTYYKMEFFMNLCLNFKLLYLCKFMGKEFFKIKINKIMSKGKLTNMAILFIEHEYTNISFDPVIGKFAN